MSVPGPQFTDLVLAFRQAKNAITNEKRGTSLFDFANFELNLTARARQLTRLLKSNKWFDRLNIGRLSVTPKSTKPMSDDASEIIRIGIPSSQRLSLNVRLQLDPTPEFAATEILYLWEFGGALEAMIDDCCVAYRLKRVRHDGTMDRMGREVFEYWPESFAKYRNDPIKMARDMLIQGHRVLITSTDVTSFYDSINTDFLLSKEFIESMSATARQKGRSFSTERYKTATSSLLQKYAEFRKLRHTFSDTLDTKSGVPIGSITARVFANVALASLDRHIRSIPEVALYRRYVDDIVIVAKKRPDEPPSENKSAVLNRYFPEFSHVTEGDRFKVPATGDSFALREEKTLIHELRGTSGLHFLDAVRQAFSAVASEQRAFLGDVDKLSDDFSGISVFPDGMDAEERVPRLRDADRLTLRRFTAKVYVRGLERCAKLLDEKEACTLIERKTQRILSAIDGLTEYEDFEFVLSLLRVAILCNCQTVAARLHAWLDARIEAENVEEVVWGNVTLPIHIVLPLMRSYLERRIQEAVASSEPLPKAWREAQMEPAALLRVTDLRRLDLEDDTMLFGVLPDPFYTEVQQDHGRARRTLVRDPMVGEALRSIRSFIERSNKLGEHIWRPQSDISLLLSTKPPGYGDVARRYLARMDTGSATSAVSGPKAEIGKTISECTDAMRGTRHAWYTRDAMALTVEQDVSLLRISERQSPECRVILANMPVRLDWFKGAANGRPVLTYGRLQGLDGCLRRARSAARQKRGLPPLVVLPELAVPRRWIRSLASYAALEDLSIVAGVEYEQRQGGLVNQAVGAFATGRRSVACVMWTKRYPARGENEELRKLKKTFRTIPRNAPRFIIESAHGRIGVLICSELLDGRALSVLSRRIELMIVPAWNDDVTSFEHTAHAAAGLLTHCFVCVANNAEASDARIVSPIKEPRYEREWCRVVHRKEHSVIWGDVPVGELRDVHNGADPRFKAMGKERIYRPLPPGP